MEDNPTAMNNNFEKHFGAIINHGEHRSDARHKPAKFNLCDSALSDLGIQQAKATGNFFKKYLFENSFDFPKIIIECSPYLKAMMTAA